MTARLVSIDRMSSAVAKNLQAFQIALNAHDRENPDHTAYGIGMAHFDLERLGFEEGEEILPGIRIEVDGGTTGNFRILCSGDHSGSAQEETEEIADAVASERVIEAMLRNYDCVSQ